MLSVWPALAADTKTAANSTTGACSAIIPNNSGTVTIHCRGLDPEMAKQLGELATQLSHLSKGSATARDQQLQIRLLRSVNERLKTLKAEPAIQVNAPVQQENIGDCNLNAIGDNNQLNCAPHLSVSPDQAKRIAEYIKKQLDSDPTIPRKIEIEWQLDPDLRLVKDSLQQAFQDAGLTVTAQGAMNIGPPADGPDKGIYFDNVRSDNSKLANAIGGALIGTNVIINKLINAHKEPFSAIGDTLSIVILKP